MHECMQSYAGPLLDILDPDHTTFEHRLFRDSCLRVPSHSQPGLAFLMKDMSALGRDLSSTIIVDNTPTVRPSPCSSIHSGFAYYLLVGIASNGFAA